MTDQEQPIRLIASHTTIAQICDICNAVFDTTAELSKHYQKYHVLANTSVRELVQPAEVQKIKIPTNGYSISDILGSKTSVVQKQADNHSNVNSSIVVGPNQCQYLNYNASLSSSGELFNLNSNNQRNEDKGPIHHVVSSSSGPFYNSNVNNQRKIENGSDYSVPSNVQEQFQSINVQLNKDSGELHERPSSTETVINVVDIEDDYINSIINNTNENSTIKFAPPSSSSIINSLSDRQDVSKKRKDKSFINQTNKKTATNLVTALPPKNTDIDISQCSLCPRFFRTQLTLSYHYKHAHGIHNHGKWCTCTFCTYSQFIGPDPENWPEFAKVAAGITPTET